MRLILGLDYADAGTAVIHGKQYAGLAYPMREVGALIDVRIDQILDRPVDRPGILIHAALNL